MTEPDPSAVQKNEATYRLLLDLVAGQHYERLGEVFGTDAVLTRCRTPPPPA